MPIVKIVILNWNGAEHLRRFLPSVVAAAPEGVGVVVADNGSTDGSVALLEREFPSVGVVRLELVIVGDACAGSGVVVG